MEHSNKITRLETQMEQVNGKLDKLDRKIEEGFREVRNELTCYVRKEEFSTVKSVVYGMVGAVLMAFIGGLIFLVFK